MPKKSESIATIEKTELHQHVDGSIPVRLTWELMKKHGINPVNTMDEMECRLVLQKEELHDRL